MIAFPRLYEDLTITKAEKLLDLDTPAFSFISSERFKYSNFPEQLLAPARQILSENKLEATKVGDGRDREGMSMGLGLILTLKLRTEWLQWTKRN